MSCLKFYTKSHGQALFSCSVLPAVPVGLLYSRESSKIKQNVLIFLLLFSFTLSSSAHHLVMYEWINATLLLDNSSNYLLAHVWLSYIWNCFYFSTRNASIMWIELNNRRPLMESNLSWSSVCEKNETSAWILFCTLHIQYNCYPWQVLLFSSCSCRTPLREKWTKIQYHCCPCPVMFFSSSSCSTSREMNIKMKMMYKISYQYSGWRYLHLLPDRGVRIKLMDGTLLVHNSSSLPSQTWLSSICMVDV